MTAAYEREKSKNMALLTQLQSFKITEVKQPTPNPIINQTDDKIARDKLAISLRKLEDERIQNQKLKSEIIVLKKYLAKEIGPDFSINKLSNDLGWKGRQEQIVLLKEKIKELKQKLDGKVDMEIYQQRQIESCEKVSNNRRRDINEAQAEIQWHKDAAQQLKLKYDAALARIKCLEKEFRDMKTKLTKCIEKGEIDNDLIAALQAEIRRLKVIYNLLLEDDERIHARFGF